MNKKNKITIETTVNSDFGKVWEHWTDPKHITKWNNASDDWHTTKAENDLQVGGRFSSRMEAKDASMGFDFGGTYSEVIPNEHIAYSLDDGRKVEISFVKTASGTTITESFEPESQNSVEMQQQGWQAILDNFKKYTESQNKSSQ